MIELNKEEITYEERVTAFKKRAEVENKMIFAFDKDNVQETVKKLEKTLTDLTRLYYKEEAKKIKKEYVKNNLPKFTLLTLNVRHYFKVAYFAEFRRDTRSALKYIQVIH